MFGRIGVLKTRKRFFFKKAKILSGAFVLAGLRAGTPTLNIFAFFFEIHKKQEES